MKPFFKRFGQPMENPEFVWPGFLMVAIGAITAIPGYFLVASYMGWSYLAQGLALVACGIAVLRKHFVGSVLYVAMLAYCFYHGIASFSGEKNDPIRFALGVLMLVSFASCAVDQFKYHASLRRKEPAE
jgi:hypothetical protein